MINAMLLDVLELKLTGFSPLFESRQLDEQAHKLMYDLNILLETNVLLQHSMLTHKFRLTVNGKNEPGLLLVIGLALRNQHVLNFGYEEKTLGEMEQCILEDRHKMVTACRNLPTQTALVAIEFSQRISAACLNMPQELLQSELSKRLKILLGVKTRRWQGSISEQSWQHDLPGLAKYEWRADHLTVRALLRRERRGFSLRLMRLELLPLMLQGVKYLRMHERPADIDKASTLDRAEHIRLPVDMIIRVGSLPGSDQLIVANFLDFKPSALLPTSM
jgi:hypothetical protein